ncbi:hypothetical protein [Metallosphaera javensis (ex Sakai et al. 2022)]|uniref:hypothetical protein n=1 Tax=Metallosphaera javensis (ex Sakai et al. 2022) TaxID=2775498 RepID=UPI002589756A|nr:MAG: hypothetical protein MjAS7_0030 [Metallosphaera javensis (ex Sakai et al. 2022)]
MDTKSQLIDFLRQRGGSAPRSSLRGYTDEFLLQLENEGIIKITKVGNGKRITLVETTPPSIVPADLSGLLNMISEINRKLDILLSSCQGSSPTTQDLDKIFEQLKNPMGLASLKDIRERMGLSREQFYSRFSSYIEHNYQLYRGGEEGIIKGGVIFGIIKR